MIYNWDKLSLHFNDENTSNLFFLLKVAVGMEVKWNDPPGPRKDQQNGGSTILAENLFSP